MTSPLLSTLSQLPLNRQREGTWTDMLEKKVGGKKEDNFNNTRKRKFSGCNLINNAKRRLGGGEIGPREQISQRSWGRTQFGRVSKAHNTAFLLHASANSNWNSVSCHTSFRSAFFYWAKFFFLLISLIHSFISLNGQHYSCLTNSLVKIGY